jgi:hypothetical protein
LLQLWAPGCFLSPFYPYSFALRGPQMGSETAFASLFSLLNQCIALQ